MEERGEIGALPLTLTILFFWLPVDNMSIVLSDSEDRLLIYIGNLYQHT